MSDDIFCPMNPKAMHGVAYISVAGDLTCACGLVLGHTSEESVVADVAKAAGVTLWEAQEAVEVVRGQRGPEAPDRAGSTFDKEKDAKRLNAQQARINKLMRDGNWRTLPELAAITGDPEASISARLRDLRKRDFGKHQLLKRRVPGKKGLWEYRVIWNTTAHADAPLVNRPTGRQ